MAESSISQSLLEPKRKRKRQRSPIERGIVWGVIILFYLTAVFEWRAKKSYTDANTVFNDVVAAAEANPEAGIHTINAAMKRIRSAPSSISNGKFGIADCEVYKWKWISLFRRYHLKVLVDPEDKSIIQFTDEE